MARERERITEDGWYRCWLRFVLALAAADAARREGRHERLDDAFAELVRDTRRFAGKPRPCDLYRIWNVIGESLTWALSLARTEEEWDGALDAITKASHETGSRFDREDGGPISTGTLLTVSAPYAADPVGGPSVRRVFEQEIDRRNQGGKHEPGRLITLASLQLAIAEHRRAFDFLRGDEAYKAHWRRAATERGRGHRARYAGWRCVTTSQPRATT